MFLLTVHVSPFQAMYEFDTKRSYYGKLGTFIFAIWRHYQPIPPIRQTKFPVMFSKVLAAATAKRPLAIVT